MLKRPMNIAFLVIALLLGIVPLSLHAMTGAYLFLITWVLVGFKDNIETKQKSRDPGVAKNE